MASRVGLTTPGVESPYSASGFRFQLLEQAVHVVTARGGRPPLLLPEVLQDEFDHDRVEDDARERGPTRPSLSRSMRRWYAQWPRGTPLG